jgi:anhydro-N-acetylmuramic acid kinase
MRIYKVIGVMSGTSMDGIDVAYCHLQEKDNGKWGYTIEKATTLSYNETWRLRLSKLRNQNALIFHKTDRYFGEYIGQLINQFIADNSLEVDLIASHGHTIFHQPEFNLTTQIGNGASISAITGIPSVTDFRAMDVVLGGQGAPLVPVGDALLFSEYDMCVNIGGFANISGLVDDKYVAYDVCPANILLNRIAREFDQEYDTDGLIAEKGSIDYELLGALNNIDYYSESYPKSLGREWINQNFWFHVRESQISKEDKMKTLCDHIAFQIGQNIELLAGDDSPSKKVLVTGGGAFNKTLIDHLRSHTDAEIVVPEDKIVDYKEALVFALMGVLRVQNKTNVYASVTGADSDSVSGALHGDFSKIA